MTPAAIAEAFHDSCIAELRALKPGNVHVHAAGHGMSVADFERSAAAAAPVLCQEDATLGDRILGAVSATRAAVGQNTNLGIALLCAPLAMAAEAGGALRDGVRWVIAASSLGDAAQVFQAIALASPGGLGDAPAHDVRAPATVTLPVAMGAAADRDAIARQWVTGFEDVFETGLPAYRQALRHWDDRDWAATGCFLALLARWPDSHIARKWGTSIAEAVCAEAAPMLAAFEAASSRNRLIAPFLAWDADLKRRGLNPGTSADLTVAAIFAERLCHGLRQARFGV